MLNLKSSLSAITVTVLMLPLYVHAAPSVNEDFDYPTGDLATQSSGAWTQNTVTAGEEWTVSAGSLGYEKNGNTLVTSGGKAGALIVDGGVSRADLDFEDTDSGTVWLGVLTARDNSNTFVEGSIRLLSPSGAANVEFGTFVSNPNVYRSRVNGVAFEATAIAPSTTLSEADLLVIEMIFPDVDADADSSDGIVNFYINPDPSATSPEAASLVRSVAGLNKFQMNIGSIRLERENFNDKTVYFDELRVGESYETVTPIPEPGSMALIGLGGLLLLGRRRVS